jgi:hypothetical protein
VKEGEMNKQILGGLGTALVAAGLVVLSVPVNAADMRCNVPFSFQVGDTTLPPGAYTVSTEQSTLTIRGANRGTFAITNRVEPKTHTPAKLVFNRYGDEYILKQAWTGGGSGRELPKSRREKQLTETKRAADAVEQVVIPIS